MTSAQVIEEVRSQDRRMGADEATSTYFSSTLHAIGKS